MKKLIIALLAITMITTVACGNQEKAPEVTETVENTVSSTDTSVETETVKNTDTIQETSSEANDKNTETSVETNTKAETKATEKKFVKPKKTTVKSKYFSLTIPASWYEQYTSEVIDNKHILINHKKSVDAGYSGNLFSVEMFCSHEDYSFYPIYTYINTVKADDGELYDIVAVYPSDTQCSENLITDYTRFANQSPSILKTIKYTDDVKIVK